MLFALVAVHGANPGSPAPRLVIKTAPLDEYGKPGFPQPVLAKAAMVDTQRIATFHKAVAAGVRLASGTDAGIYRPDKTRGGSTTWSSAA